MNGLVICYKNATQLRIFHLRRNKCEGQELDKVRFFTSSITFTRCSFYLQPCEGSAVQIVTQEKLSAPRILRKHKVVNYVVEKMILDKPLGSSVTPEGTFTPGLSGGQLQHSAVGDVTFQAGLKPWQKLRPSIEILCNNQASG